MKEINFTEKELDFLRTQYQDELESARKYIDQISGILKKLESSLTLKGEEPVEQGPGEVKRRGRKPKEKTLITKEPKKRGRKPRAETVEPKIPKKRGRPFKSATIPAIDTSPATTIKEPKKRGRKPRVIVTSEPKPLPVPAAKDVKKIITKKKTSRRTRKWKGVRLTPMNKPIRLKEPKEEPVEETVSVNEPVIVVTGEPTE